MLICTECGEHFEKARVEKEIHTELQGLPFEQFAECPFCGDGDIEEAKRCDCGEWIAKSSLLCKTCKIITDNEMAQFRRSLSDNQVLYLGLEC